MGSGTSVQAASTIPRIRRLKCARCSGTPRSSGWRAVEYVDEGVSGAKDRRPALDRLVADVRRPLVEEEHEMTEVAAEPIEGASTR